MGPLLDAPSIGSAHDGVPVHQEGLSRGMRYVEILTNLGELPLRGTYFIFMPVKITGSSGGPGDGVAPGVEWELCALSVQAPPHVVACPQTNDKSVEV